MTAASKARIKPTRRTSSRVKADRIDFRDCLYTPPVRGRPPAILNPRKKIPVLDQGLTSACTGFALASVVHWLLDVEPRAGAARQVSPYMLYSMARRYDEFPGAVKDEGSSIRGALKGWHKHGAARLELWRELTMPKVPADPTKDWWSDAIRRPLGAYYRIDPQELPAMHVALDEVGIVYASVVAHAGWEEGYDARPSRDAFWTIPQQSVTARDGGHAFVIVGYTEDGFIIQNSWGERWGSGGLALLTYRDWRENAMDCWVAQMGVVTSLHLQIAQSASLRRVRGKVEIAAEERLRNHEIAPYVVNMDNNGTLSESGNFRTTPGDVQALVTTYLARARDEWALDDDEPADIAIYAHGGLVSEDDAAATAATWIPALYDAKVFPIFMMWETDLLNTLVNMIRDIFEGEPRKVAGIQQWWNERVERTIAEPGTAIWGEMKENGAAISSGADSGGVLLYRYATQSSAFDFKRDRVHLIGHSAGAIVHAHLADALVRRGWTFASANMMAPAATVDLFEEKMLPHVRSKKIEHYNQWHLSETLEEKDPTCRAILLYGRSLLYLVSQSFEGGLRTPVIGMKRYHDEVSLPGNARAWTAVSSATESTTHGGFDEDEVTRRSVIRAIRAAA